MSLSKKHFRAIAEILARYKASDELIEEFINYFKSENGLFSRNTFLEFVEKLTTEATERNLTAINQN